MSLAVHKSEIAAGMIVRLHGISDSPDMLVMECDRSAADCVWFNRNVDLARSRFPLWALEAAAEGGRDSGRIATFGAVR
jgi:hypothetical protein